MIGKIKKGSGFKGCVNYVLGKEQAVLLHADGVLTESRGDIIHSCNTGTVYCRQCRRAG